MRQGVSIRRLGLALAVAGGVGFASSAQATTTNVVQSSSEANHQEVFEHLFGTSFESNGLNYTNGSVTLERVSDDDDQVIAAGSYEVQAVGAFSALNHNFGYMAGTEGGSFTELFALSGNGFDASGSAVVDVNNDFRWARQGVNGTFTTSAADNHGGYDHVVTYRVVGTDTVILFFEDLAQPGSDLDFNDLIVQVTGLLPAAVIPVPAAAGPGIALLLALGGSRYLRRRT